MLRLTAVLGDQEDSLRAPTAVQTDRSGPAQQSPNPEAVHGARLASERGILPFCSVSQVRCLGWVRAVGRAPAPWVLAGSMV